MFQDKRFDFVMSVIEIDCREKRFERVGEQFSLKKIFEIAAQAFADEKDCLELKGLRDSAQDLLRDYDRPELRKHTLIGFGEFLEKFLADDLIQNGVSEEFQPVKILKAPGRPEVLIAERGMCQRGAIKGQGFH